MNKNTIGGLIIVGGIAYLGYMWFKRNKPTTSQAQVSQLSALSANLATSADKIDKPLKYSQSQSESQIKNPYTPPSFAQVDYQSLTPKQQTELAAAVNQACPSCSTIGNFGTSQIAANMQNADFTNVRIPMG